MPPYFLSAVMCTLLLRCGWKLLTLPPNKPTLAIVYAMGIMWCTTFAIQLHRAGL